MQIFVVYVNSVKFNGLLYSEIIVGEKRVSTLSPLFVLWNVSTYYCGSGVKDVENVGFGPHLFYGALHKKTRKAHCIRLETEKFRECRFNDVGKIRLKIS